MGSAALYIVCCRYVVCSALTYILATNIGATYIIYSVLLCAVGTATLCLEHRYFKCCMLCTAKRFVPLALLFYKLYTVYCHLFVLWALLCFVHVWCTAVRSVP